jgi:putative NADH-flavin reductase
MNILILGSTGGTGRALVEQALELGHVVTAFARDPSKMRITHKNLRVVRGDVLDYDSVEAALRGQDAVLSALGSGVLVGPLIAVVLASQVVARFAHLTGPVGWLIRIGVPVLAVFLLNGRTNTLSEGTKNILRGMEQVGVKRLVCESSLGIGDSKGQLGFLYNYVLIPILLRNIFADKEIQEKLIGESNLDWVIVRPAALSNGPKTRVYRSGFDTTDRSIQAKISRADVAEFMLAQLTGDAYLRRTPGVSY